VDTLVSVNELAVSLDNPDWLVVDCRFSLADAEAGQRAYSEAHIPGAFYTHLEEQMSSPQVPGKTGRHPLPEKTRWIETIQSLGITPATQVVMYDDVGGACAARMWWMLRWIGHEQAAVLNGGLQAWQRAGHEVNSDNPSSRPVGENDYAGLRSLVELIDASDIDPSKQLLLDARDLPRYRGEMEPIDPVAGHIPGALCSPFSGNLDENSHFLDPVKLGEKFRQAAESTLPVVCYCGSGVTAAHNILAMTIAGMDNCILYPGSWSDWITDPNRPVAIGDGS
jgi:thiosulfate/3-mercaptopyruvate sulfurtransferase